MRHKLFTLLLALIAGVGTIFAAGVEVDGIWYTFTTKTKTATVTYEGSSSSSFPDEYTGDVVIPDTVLYDDAKYCVTIIGYAAFSGCKNLTSVKIPNTVTSIEASAFYQCTALPSIDIPNTVTSIEASAFYQCTALASIDIPNSVTSIGKNAFNGCTGLTSVIIGDGVTSMGTNVFQGCTSLNSVTIGSSLKKIEDYTFQGCKKLTSIDIPNNVTSIGSYVFKDCIRLTSVKMSNDVKGFGTNVFNGCSALTSFEIPNVATRINYRTFYNCAALTSINIPDGVTFIDSEAFYGCASLTSIDIPKGVKSIEMNTFYECTGLISVTMGDSVTSIGQCAFYKCKNLTSINLPNTIKSIAYGAFWVCSSLASITIPDGITSIESKAFSGCAMTSINIPDGVTQLGDYAFNGCSSLSSVTIGTGITSIENYTFAGCSGLTSVMIGENVTSIGQYAFKECKSLAAITIPSSVTKIGANAFDKCEGLKTVICKPTTPPEYGSHCFHIYCCGASILIPISTLKVPAESVELYKNAEGWKEAFTEIMPMSETGTISVTLPTDVSDGYYENMTLELHNLNIQLVQNRPVLNKREFEFSDQMKENKYQAILKNAYGQVMGQTEAMELGEEDLTLVIDSLLQKKDVSLKVTIPDGTDVSDKVSVLWTDEAKKALGYAAGLKAVAEGTKLTCKVTLRGELARQYAAPDVMQLTVSGDGENLLAVSLQPIQMLTLRGIVKDKKTGEVIANATVALTQQVGDNYGESITATTDNDGRYELQGANGPGELSVTAPSYLNKTVKYDAQEAEGTLPIVEMEPFNGVIVTPLFTYTEAAPEGTESNFTDGYDTFGDVSWQVYNKTQKMQITYFFVKNDALYFPSAVATGDELTITASSHSNKFASVSASCEIENSGLGYVTLPLVQKGGMEATVNSAASRSVMGMLYDANGRLVNSKTYRLGKLSLAGLTAGDYTLISMTSDIFLERVLLLSTFSDIGLVEGTDYVKNIVHIEDGRIATVNVANVPELDTEKFHFFENTRTHFIVKNSIVSVGESTTSLSRVAFAEQYEGRISNVELVVDMPDEKDLVVHSARTNGIFAWNHWIENGHYIFEIAGLGTDNCFSMKTKTVGKFRVSASVRFTLDGVLQLVKPLKTVWLQANGFTMSTPWFKSNTTLYVSGSASLTDGGKKVEIYDYDKLVGTTSVNYVGKWNTNITYPAKGTADLHAIKARITTSEGVVESEVKYVLRTDNTKIAKKVVMIDQTKKHHTFNYFASSSNVGYGYVLEKTWTQFNYDKEYGTTFNTEFTFLAYFDDLDVSDADKVKIAVLASDGTTRTMDASYDAKKQCYYATTHYTHYSKAPISTYAFTDGGYSSLSEEEQSALTEAQRKAVVSVTKATVHAAKAKGETEVQPSDDETLNLIYTISEKESYAFSMKEMNYDSAAAYVMENGPLFYRGEAGSIVYTFVNGEEEAEMILIDVEGHFALRTEITYAEIDDLAANSRKRSVGSRKTGVAGFFNGAGKLGSGILTGLGLMDYINAPGQVSEIDAMREKLEKAMKKRSDEIDNAMGGKCADGSSGEPGFSDEDMDDYIDRYNDLIERGNELIFQLREAYNSYLADLGRKMIWDAGTTVLTGGIGKAVAAGAATKLGPKAMAALDKAGALLETDAGEAAASVLGFGKDLLQGGQFGNPSLDQLLSIDFNRHYKEFKDNLERQVNDVINGLKDLHRDMVDNQEECEECEGEECEECEEDDEDCEECEEGDEECKDKKRKRRREPKDDTTPPPYPFPKPACLHIDPSGFIYEAVPSNRVEGATAVLYYKDYMLDEDGNSTGETDVMWDAENHGQINPQITGADGMYQWDVPQGLWQVRVSKEGYENTSTEWLPVPPPQLDVNIPIIRNRLPQVEKAHAYVDAVAVKFDSYMLPEYLNTDQITVTENGETVAGTIELTDEEVAPDSATYASKLRFIPSKAFTAAQVTLNISGLVQSYSGIEMDVPFEAVLPIERELKKLVADEKVKVEYESTGVIRVKGEPAAAAAGKTVKVQCASGIITSATQATVVLNQNGEADVIINGDLPGTDYVTFRMDDNELTASTTVKVVLNLAVHVDAPEASVPTETAVEKGTQVTLNCKTEGAEIYYTLDGSNPLSSDTRILYDGTPIVINAETTLTAVAVVDGKGESEVVVFHYTVKVGTQITDLAGSEGRVTPVRVHDSFEVTGVDGTFSVSVYSMSGKLLMKIEQMHSGRRVNASALQPGIHLVVVNGENAYFTQRIIKE